MGKILYIAAESSISGANKSMCILAEYTRNMGKNVLVLLPKHGSIEKELIERKIDYEIIKSYSWTEKIGENRLKEFAKGIIKKFLNLISIYKIKKLIKERNINLIHINSLSSYVGLIAGYKENIPTVLHIREFLEEDHGLKINELFNDKKIVNYASKIITISKSIYEKFSKKYDYNKMVMIYNGIKVNDYIYKSQRMNNKNITISIIGRVKQGKGQLELIEAINILNKKNINNINVNIIGSRISKYAKNVVQKVNEYNLNECVKFIDETKEIEQYYKESDIIAVCSRNEAFGRVTIEAMLSSCLVIGSDTAGTKELIGKDNGFLYKQGDFYDLANKIQYAITNKEKVNEIIVNALENAKENYNSEKNAEGVNKVYKEILGGNKNV